MERARGEKVRRKRQATSWGEKEKEVIERQIKKKRKEASEEERRRDAILYSFQTCYLKMFVSGHKGEP